ncbi:MAG: CopD family protein [Acidobacteriota bacterium]
MYRLSVWIHIVMASIWVGGLIYTMTAVIPFALSLSKEERQPILRGLARRFRRIGWSAIGILIITGLVNIFYRTIDYQVNSVGGIKSVAGSIRYDESFMKWLAVKLILVVLMVALMLFHDITSLRDAKRHAGQEGSPPHNRAGSIAAALATLLAIIIVYVSVRLVRG